MDDELVTAEIAQLLNLDRVGSHRHEADLVSLARGLSIFERRHFSHQYRLPPVPVPVHVAVDGRAPDPPPGVFWLPATADGEGDAAGGEGKARVGAAVAVAAGVTVPDGDAEADRPGEDKDGEAGVALSARMADGVAALGDGLGPGLSAIDPVDEAANTAAPSAARPSRAISGTTAILLPRGRSSRQLGQKPETGVK